MERTFTIKADTKYFVLKLYGLNLDSDYTRAIIVPKKYEYLEEACDAAILLLEYTGCKIEVLERYKSVTRRGVFKYTDVYIKEFKSSATLI